MVLNRLEGGTGRQRTGSVEPVRRRLFHLPGHACGCAKRTVQLAKEAGVTHSQAQAQPIPTRGIRRTEISALLPTYPTPEELKSAMDMSILCVKMAGIESVVNQELRYWDTINRQQPGRKGEQVWRNYIILMTMCSKGSKRASSRYTGLYGQ